VVLLHCVGSFFAFLTTIGVTTLTETKKSCKEFISRSQNRERESRSAQHPYSNHNAVNSSFSLDGNVRGLLQHGAGLLGLEIRQNQAMECSSRQCYFVCTCNAVMQSPHKNMTRHTPNGPHLLALVFNAKSFHLLRHSR
jgi:hypothetical protein